MIGGLFRFIEKSIPLIAGIVFAVVGVIAAINLPESNNKIIATYLTYLVFHSSVMLIVGGFMQKAKKPLAISWLLALLFFFVVAIIFKN